MATREKQRINHMIRQAIRLDIGALSLILMASILAGQSFTLESRATTLRGHLETVSIATPQPPPPNSFPASYQGTWRCESTVVDSGVASILTGTKSTCEIQFKAAVDGRILANWSQPGWTEAESTPMSFSDEKARVDRTNYYWAEGINGSWAARSRDDFNRVDANTIVAKSYIDQYVDGQYVGRYRTTSVLRRVPDNEGLAGTFKQDSDLFGGCRN